MSNVEQSLKNIAGPDIAMRVSELQAAGNGILSQYSIGIPPTFQSGPMQLPITVLDTSGHNRVHIGNLAIVVRDKKVQDQDMEFVWYNEPRPYAGDEYQFYGDVDMPTVGVNTALDRINHVLIALDFALKSPSADALVANAISRRPVYQEEIQATRTSAQPGVQVLRPGARGWSSHRGTSPSRQARPAYSGGREIDVSKMPVSRRSRASGRGMQQSSPSTGNLKVDMEQYLASSKSPLWYSQVSITSARQKLRDYIVNGYLRACEVGDTHIQPDHYVTEVVQTILLKDGFLAPFCKLLTIRPAVKFDEHGALCDKGNCNRHAVNHGDCDQLVLRMSEDF